MASQVPLHERLESLDIRLPSPPKPVASYLPAVLDGSRVLVSGQLPMVDGTLHRTGLLPDDCSLEDAVACARLCAINGLAAAGSVVGLDQISGVLRLGCFVAAPATFTQHPQVANGASDLLQEIFGEAGRHARAAVGVPSLPLNAPVEIEFMFRVG